MSDKNHLNEKSSTRGSNCTSIDALIYGKLEDDKRIIFPIEWKYVESYSNEDKSKGDSGNVRKSSYTCLINNSTQLQHNTHDIYYYEPFYQLMRQTLWSEQMIINSDKETIKVDEYLHMHVISDGNKKLLEKTYICCNNNMENIWRNQLNCQNKYKIISPKELLSAINDNQYIKFIDYLENRYW